MLGDPSGHLPVAVKRFDAESGMSHVMRAFWGNGMSMGRAYEWLQVRRGKPLRDVDARVLAWAVQAPPDWLADRLFVVSGQVDDRRLRLGARRFSAASLLSGKSARICPNCLSEFGFCELSWCFKLAPVCPRHKVPYLGICVHCGRSITWDRPQIDICNCGRYFKPASIVAEPPAALIGWVHWVAARLAPPSVAFPGGEGHLVVPRMLNELTLDGAFRLIEAFGLLQRPDEQPLAAAAASRSIAGAIGLIARGLERLALIDGRPHRVRALAPQIHISALERLRAHAADTVDANCAALLLRHLGDRSDCDVDMRGRYARGQLVLFT
jgi:hypothetical protein